MKRADKAELNRRIAIVTDLIAKKLKRSEIMEYCIQDLEWPISYQMMSSYIKRAKDQIVQMLEKSAEQNLAEGVMDLKHLYRKALEKENYATALNVRKELNRVLRVGEYEVPRENPRGELSEELESMITDLTPTRKTLIRPSGETVTAKTNSRSYLKRYPQPS